MIFSFFVFQLVPLFVIIGAGGVGAGLYLMRLAMFNPDVRYVNPVIPSASPLAAYVTFCCLRFCISGGLNVLIQYHLMLACRAFLDLEISLFTMMFRDCWQRMEPFSVEICGDG